MVLDRVAVVDWSRLSEPVTAMLPLMGEQTRSVSVLAPPVKVMALACAPPPPALPPEMVPLLTIVMPEPETPAPPAPAVPAVLVPLMMAPPAPPLPPVIV